MIRPKAAPLRLDPLSYESLRRQILRKRPSCTVLLSVHETVKWTLQQAWY